MIRTLPSVSVSCVITSYNYGRYLAEAIDSVLAQSYPVNQIIVVDDGSTDNSSEVAREYGSKIELITQANSGVVAARNNGARAATGDYIFFLDADDVLRPAFVATLAMAIESSDQPEVALAYCDFSYFGAETGQVSACSWNSKKLLYRNYIIGAAMMTKEAFDQVGGYSQQLNQKASFEDWDLWLCLLEAGYAGEYVAQDLFAYRLHGAGRNGPALQDRPAMEARLRRRHTKLYQKPINRFYLAVFGSASRVRNKLVRAPGT